MSLVDFVQYLGSASGIIGSIWLTHKLPGYNYGFVVFLLASVSMATFFWIENLWPGLAMEVVFIYSNVVGVKRWILAPEKT